MATTHGNGEWWNGNGNGRESKIKPVRVSPAKRPVSAALHSTSLVFRW